MNGGTRREAHSTDTYTAPGPATRIPYTLRSLQFRKEREASWQELEGLLSRTGGAGLPKLRNDEIVRLVELYRAAGSSLSVARAISLDRNVVEYLEGLTQRAYLVLYAPRRRFLGAIAEFFTRDFPRWVRRLRVPLTLTITVFLAGILTGNRIVHGDSERFYSFVSQEMAQGRGPHTEPAELLEILKGDPESAGELSVFASFLLSHNAQIGLLSFGIGFLGGLPALILVLVNGLGLGAFVAIHERAGLGLDFWAWVLPHGIPEMFAMCLCAAAGLSVGQALLFPGPYRRWDAVTRAGRRSATLVVGAVALFMLAALLEGFFRQLVTSTTVRLVVATVSFLAVVGYFGFVGRGSDSGGRWPAHGEDAR